MFDDTMIAKFVSSPNEFTIELTEEVWTILGWSEKRNCVRKLKEELIEGVDFSLLKIEQPVNHAGLSAQELGALASREDYLLSYNGLKLLAANAPGDKGKAYRRHLVEVENRYYQLIAVAKETVTKALPPMWKENRLLLSDVETGYQRWCVANGFSASHITNVIYKMVCNGDTAAELRLKALVDGNASVAANHIGDSDLLQEVALLKQQLTRYQRKFITMYDAVKQAANDLERRRK